MNPIIYRASMSGHRDPGVAHNTMHSMTGSEFTGVGTVFAPLAMLPPTLRLVALSVLILIGVGGCTAAWIDYRDYTPSPNICRSLNSGVPAERPGSCVPASRLSEVAR